MARAVHRRRRGRFSRRFWLVDVANAVSIQRSELRTVLTGGVVGWVCPLSTPWTERDGGALGPFFLHMGRASCISQWLGQAGGLSPVATVDLNEACMPVGWHKDLGRYRRLDRVADTALLLLWMQDTLVDRLWMGNKDQTALLEG